MIVLDTNVLSEMMRPPDRRSSVVFGWVSSRPGEDLFTTAVTTAELLAGVAVMPDGRRKADLENGVVRITSLFGARILSFDHAAAHHYAALMRVRRQSGRPAGSFDIMIAAIARANGMAVATRNVADFADCGVGLVNPWDA